MKKSIYCISILCILFFALGYAHHIFYNQIHSVLFYITEKNPIEWANISIPYEFGMHSYDENNIFSLHFYGKENEGIVIERNAIFNDRINILNFLQQKKNTILSQYEGKFNKLDAIFIKMQGNDQNKYINAIYIPEKNISIGYIGPVEHYTMYKNIIERTTFIK